MGLLIVVILLATAAIIACVLTKNTHNSHTITIKPCPIPIQVSVVSDGDMIVLLDNGRIFRCTTSNGAFWYEIKGPWNEE